LNRTDRLYAIVEALRAASPRARTARALADRFEVSVRTIERDLLALQEAGVPIWAAPGPGGGYTLDASAALPAVNFTASEAIALAIALSRAGAMPFRREARTALEKLVAAMSSTSADEAHRLADRVRLMVRTDDQPPVPVPAALEQAVLERRVVELDYEDRDGNRGVRKVEPAGFVGSDLHWYVVAWCRLRRDGRTFRIDRIHRVTLLTELAPARSFELVSSDLPPAVRPLFE
jgi:predicted DNA-binding transcriptional regulator YafY